VRLVPARDLTRLEEARGSFRAGVALLQRRQYGAADSAFGVVATALPTAPEPYYNRALSRAARGARASALEDFEKYLELAPAAPDRNAVRSTMAQLPDRLYRPASALGSGLVLPGLGQMNTGRPLFGVLLLGAAGGAATFAVTAKHSTEERTFQLPFGGGTYTERVPITTHPNLVTGGVALAVVWLGGALEASAFARRSRSKAEGVLEIRPPAVKASSPGAEPAAGPDRELAESGRAGSRARAERDRPRVALQIAPTSRGTTLGMRVAFGGAPSR
jgi:tetratricopeptide (TPR) repeat protein